MIQGLDIQYNPRYFLVYEPEKTGCFLPEVPT